MSKLINLSNVKKITLLTTLLEVVAISGASIYYVVSNNTSKASADISDCTNHIGNHYAYKAPTYTTSGNKEFWVCCNCHEVYLEAPSTGTWTDQGQIEGDLPNDHKAYLAPLTITSITVKTLPTKTTYHVNDTFDSTGLVVEAIYSDESRIVISDYVLSTPDMTTKGEKSVSVTYLTFDTSFDIIVQDHTLFYTATMPQDPNKSLYNQEYAITCDDVNWNIQANLVGSDGAKIGGKGSTVNRTLYNTSTISSGTNISKIILNHNGRVTTSFVLNDITLVIASDSSFENVIGTIIKNNPDTSEAGSISFLPKDDSHYASTEWPAGSYFKFTFNCTLSHSKNVAFKLVSLNFFYWNHK